MKYQRLGVAGLAAALSAATSTPVVAQAWIGQVVGDMVAQQQAAANEAACMRGEPPVEDEILEARLPANAKMQAYFSAMQAGSVPRSQFFALDRHAAWRDGDTNLDRDDLDQGSDRLATPGMTLDREPFQFFRSYSDASAYGQWPVRDEAGTVAGVYNAFLVRKLGVWKLRSIVIEGAEEYSGPVYQFCHEPGDVLPHRIEQSSSQIEYHSRRIERAETKLARALENRTKYEKRAAEKPNSSRVKDRLASARERVAKWEGEVSERTAALRTAQSNHDAAIADRDARPAKAAAARTRLGIAN